MKLPFHVATRGIALALLLLGGCLSNPEPPTPANKPQTTSLDVETLKKSFLDKHYDQQLVQPVTNQDHTKGTWTWTPLWQKAVQKRTQAATYTYVPLEAYLEARPYVVTLVGCCRYLLVKSTSSGLEFSTVLYVYNQPKAGAQSQFKLEDLPYFTNFTGVTLVQNLATGEQSRFVYNNGVRQTVARGQKAASSPAGTSGSKTTACSITYVCEWTGYCEGSSVTWQVYTSGTDYCREPDSGGVCYLSISWAQTGAWTRTYCDDGSGDDGGCPSCGGGCSSCGDGPTGPTPPTNLNSPCGKMYTLNTTSGFQTAVTQLKQPSFLTGNHEVGFIYTGNGADFANYRSMSGTNTQINYQLPYPIDGDMHVHNLYASDSKDEALPVPSPTDIVTIYSHWRNGNIINDGNYTSTVITAFGDMYAIKIRNSADFQSFGSSFLMSYGYVDRLFFCPKCDYPLQAGTASMSGQSAFKVSNEINLLKFLKDNNTGLALLKYDPASGTWFQRSLDSNNNLLNDPCQ